MSKLAKILNDYTLPIAMLIGVVGYKWFVHLSALLPPLIFFMLFFTFCKINPLDLRLHRWHFIVLAIQLALTVLSYFLLLPIDALLAQGVMLCFIMPAATAGPIIAGKLGGSIQSLTSFTMLSNFATAIIVPMFFPIVNPAADLSFRQACWLILQKVAPLLIGPFLLAWLLRLAYDAYQKKHNSPKRFQLSRSWASVPFYLWAVSLVVLMAQITMFLLTEEYDTKIVLLLTVCALAACLLQFMIGKKVGEHFPSYPHGEDYHDVLVSELAATDDMRLVTRISAGQAFGQKNTTLGIWMAYAYLNPLSSVGAAAYIVWQNLFNSYQLARAAHGKKV